jgi:hypothetical protein
MSKYDGKINIVENLLGRNQFEFAQARLLDNAIHWYYLPFTADPTDLTTIREYAGSFSHLIVKEGEPISNLAELCTHICMTACDRNGQQLQDISRIRLGLCTRTPHAIQHSPHIDIAGPHRTGIFYPADSSGDTVVFEQRHESKNYTEWFRQRPTANLWFDFPGEHFHSSTSPSEHEERVVLTINYRVK